MTWLTWRQFRVQAVSVYAALAVIGVVLAITGPDLVGETDFSDVGFLYGGGLVVVYLVPAVVGVFWGVPMVTRELETGTHNLVWNQTVTRKRWLATKLGIGVPAAVVAAGLLSLGVGWWADPIDSLASQEPGGSLLTRMSPVVFGARGIVPIGYTAFALVLGVAIGMVLRRTMAAMAVTLVVFTAVLVAVPFLVRPHVMPPAEETVAITASNLWQTRGNGDSAVLESLTVTGPAGAWVLTNKTLDAAGNEVYPLPEVVWACVPRPSEDVPFPSHRSIAECMAQLSDLGYRQHLTYHPAGRFWPLQLLETAMLLALSALLTWFCFRRLRHLS